jgi:hypothetical protein
MSGPLSSNEIEDVVSSVRRLVSVDARPRPVTRDLAQDRLVLTPALRIVPEAANSPLILSGPVQDAVADPAEDPAKTQDMTIQAFEAEWEEEIWAEPEPPLAELALEVEEAEVVAESAARGMATAEPVPTDDPVDEEAPMVEIGDDWLDLDSAPRTPSPTDWTTEHVWARSAAGPSESPAGKPSVLELSAADMLTDGEGNPLTVMDEAALQQIIRQLIREEFKGALGERITQSVRKLVRAEINRALAAHALD